MGDELEVLFGRAIQVAKDNPSTREISLVITKIQEAAMWYREHKVQLSKKAEQSGVGMKVQET